MIRIEVARTNSQGGRIESIAFSLQDTGVPISVISNQIRTALSGSPERWGSYYGLSPAESSGLKKTDDDLARQRINVDDDDLERSLSAMQIADVEDV